jgi:hypothetical protein
MSCIKAGHLNACTGITRETCLSLSIPQPFLFAESLIKIMISKLGYEI